MRYLQISEKNQANNPKCFLWIFKKFSGDIDTSYKKSHRKEIFLHIRLNASTKLWIWNHVANGIRLWHNTEPNRFEETTVNTFIKTVQLHFKMFIWYISNKKNYEMFPFCDCQLTTFQWFNWWFFFWLILLYHWKKKRYCNQEQTCAAKKESKE